MAKIASLRQRVSWAWWPMFLLAISIAGYGLSYFVRGEAAFPNYLRDSFLALPWGIHTHVFFAPIALALGPFQIPA